MKKKDIFNEYVGIGSIIIIMILAAAGVYYYLSNQPVTPATQQTIKTPIHR
jgi:uncharacterized membrane protein YukC